MVLGGHADTDYPRRRRDATTRRPRARGRRRIGGGRVVRSGHELVERGRKHEFARSGATATRLTNGKVLVAGGGLFSGDAELYDPSTNAWSAAGTLSEIRSGHGAVLLHDGRVMIVAGSHPHPSATAEIYTPATNSWSPAASMTQSRGAASVSLLADGRVLVAGGVFGTTAFASTEIYDPAGDIWSAGPPASTPRGGQDAVALSAGRILVVGGANSTGDLSVAELYDAGSSTWSTTGSMSNPREFLVLALLMNGNVLATGGEDPGPIPYAEMYTPPCFTGCASVGDVTLAPEALRPASRAGAASGAIHSGWRYEALVIAIGVLCGGAVTACAVRRRVPPSVR
jgi:hypothetical protein